jgi:hypothetical protein
MAKKVDHKWRARNQKYNWDDWLDGGTWELRHGEDYDCHINVFRNLLWTACKKRGLKARTQAIEGGIRIQARRPESGLD